MAWRSRSVRLGGRLRSRTLICTSQIDLGLPEVHLIEFSVDLALIFHGSSSHCGINGTLPGTSWF